MMIRILPALLISITTSCTQKPKLSLDRNDKPTKDELDSRIAIFDDFAKFMAKNCNSCHSTGSIASSSDFEKLKNPADWLASRYIQAGSPSESSLYYRLNGSPASKAGQPQDMPSPTDQLGNEDLNTIANFITHIEEIVAASENSLQFNAELSRINPLPFKTLLHKLAFLADIAPENLDAQAEFADLLANRYLLGDYDFSQGIVEQSSWGATQLEIWLTSLESFCSSPNTLQRYNSKLEEFELRAFGTTQTQLTSSIKSDLSALPLTDTERFSAGCLLILGSLEFRTQSATPAGGMQSYLSLLASTVMERPLTAEERKISSRKGLEVTLDRWLTSNQFLESVRQYTEKLLKASGTSDDIDFSLPSNLAVAIVKAQKPYEEILTSQDCYNRSGEKTSCDSGSPQEAGVLTTRAFLSVNKGPFNLSRAGNMLESFACKHYPLDEDLEPKLEQASMIPIFAKTFGEGFGNGTNCYSCHSQFGKHTQLFVKYDSNGYYQGDASGIQDPSPEVTSGHSPNGTFVSHFKDSSRAASESSEFFGQSVENISDAAKVLVADPSFMTCTVSNVLGYYLRLKDTTKASISDRLLGSIAKKIRDKNKQPSFQDILREALTHPEVIQSIVAED
ncbi:c-type cytochrome [Pseudobacteriovorax antillogorgiicola]|nr:cytochrome c [Pseudobacteriovorax antillogorgiicola]